MLLATSIESIPISAVHTITMVECRCRIMLSYAFHSVWTQPFWPWGTCSLIFGWPKLQLEHVRLDGPAPCPPYRPCHVISAGVCRTAPSCCSGNALSDSGGCSRPWAVVQHGSPAPAALQEQLRSLAWKTWRAGHWQMPGWSVLESPSRRSFVWLWWEEGRPVQVQLMP